MKCITHGREAEPTLLGFSPQQRCMAGQVEDCLKYAATDAAFLSEVTGPAKSRMSLMPKAVRARKTENRARTIRALAFRSCCYNDN
jgi:hypothetical protein